MPCTSNPITFTPITTGCPISLAVVSKKSGCCPDGLSPGPANTILGVSPDGQSFAWFAMHSPAHLVSEAAPFSWDDATQCGVIPLPGRLVNNGNGSFTFTPGDGTAPTTIQWTITQSDAPFAWNPATFTLNIPQAASLVQNPDGSFTFDPGDGSAPVTVPLVITQSAAPFAWNPATRTLNLPQSPQLIANPDGSHTFIAGDGSPSVTIPADCCPTLTNNPAPFAWNSAIQTGNIPTPTLTANGDGSFTYDPGDGSGPVIIPADCCPTLVDNNDGTYTYNQNDGSAPVILVSHDPLTLTNNQDITSADPRATLDIANQILNLPPRIYAHRRYDGPSQGAVLVPQNIWQAIPLTNAAAGPGIVIDTTASIGAPMANGVPPGPGGIVIQRAGYYQLWAGITWFPASGGAGITHGTQIVVNGATFAHGTNPSLAVDRFSSYAHFQNRLNVGDLITLNGRSENPGGNQHFSADLTVEWIAD